MITGAQLYTVRDFCTTTESFSETLKKVADIGYKTVQVSGTCAYDPNWLKNELDKNGLKCVLTHINQQRLKEETEAVCDEHSIFGCNNIGIGSIPGAFPMNEEKYQAFLKDYLPVGKALKSCGKKLFLHNHYEEFRKLEGGGNLMTRILTDTKPDELGITLDTYWVQYAGGDVLEYMELLNGRIECIHLKDMAIGEDKAEHRMMPVGYGNLNFERIISKAGECGTQYLLVEQDNSNGLDPFDCLRMSYDYLRSLGLE